MTPAHRSRPAVRTVLIPLTAAAGESLPSWLVRTAEANVLPDWNVIVRRAGCSYAAGATSVLTGDVDTSVLAVLLGAREDEVGARMLTTDPDLAGFVRLNGVPIRQSQLVTRRRRFAPGSLARLGHDRAVWMATAVPYCTLTWQYLQEQCASCGRMQSWRLVKDILRCCHCGADLRDQAAEAVAPGIRADLSRVAALIDHDDGVRRAALAGLPRRFRNFAAEDVLEMIRDLSLLVDPAGGAMSPKFAAPERLRLASENTAKAWRLVTERSGTLDGLLEDMAFSKEPGARKQKAILGRILSRHRELDPPPALRSFYDGLIAELDSNAPDSQLMSANHAGWALGFNSNVAMRAQADGLLQRRFRISDGRLIPCFDRDEIEELVRSRDDRASPFRAAETLGVPPYAIPQLIEANLIEACRHPWFERRYGLQPSRRSVAKLMTRLEEASGTSIEDAVPLGALMRVHGGTAKPWAAAIQTLLDGGIPFRTPVQASSVRRILVPQSAAPVLTALPSGLGMPEYSQADMVDLLDLRPDQLSGLRRHCESIGPRKRFRITAKTAERLMRTHVTTTEIAARRGLHPFSVAKTLRGAGLRKKGLGWCRISAERIFPRA